METLATAVLAVIPRWLRRRCPRTPAEFVVDAVTDAFVRDYLARPGRFDPGAGALFSWLELAARRNLQNRLEAEARLRAREQQFVAERPSVVASPGNDDRSRDTIRHVLNRICQPHELQAALLCMAGERRAAVIAAALGLSSALSDQNRRDVKRFKDRLQKRLSALLQKKSIG